MKKIVSLIFIVLFFFFFSLSVSAEEIKSFDVNIIVNKDGTVNVSEKINYDFGSLQRHGIFRTIPFIKTNKQGKRFKLELNNISVKDEKGDKYRFTQSDEGGNLKLKIGDPDRTISGSHTYVINYQVAGAISYFSDHDELYWNMTGNDWPVPILFSTASVELPAEVSEKDIKTACYTGSTGATESTCQVSQRGNRATIVITKPLNSYQGMTVVVGFPIDVVARLEPKEVVSFWQTFIGKLVALIIALLALFWYLIYPIKIIYRWVRYGRDPQSQIKELRAWYDPPKTKKGRNLTPAEVGSLIDETVQIRDIAAGIVDLARRGYLKIEERKKNDFYFIKKRDYLKDSSLLPFEKKLLEGFFGRSEVIRIKDRRLARLVDEVKELIYEQLVEEELFPKNPNSIRNFYTIIGTLALFTLNIPLALIAFTFGKAMPAKTIFGVEAANIAKSLRNFLTSQARQLEFQADKQMMFERLLPYAVAFGVERIWAQRFKDMEIKQPEWYSSYQSSKSFNSVFFTRSLHLSISSFRASATPTTSSSGFSSGFSGGSSGGGGGGGGGGSW